MLIILLCWLPRCVHVGCGSIEEVILRDVPRTFPEHPLFNTPVGQQKLFRVLKAYAAADPEVCLRTEMEHSKGIGKACRKEGTGWHGMLCHWTKRWCKCRCIGMHVCMYF
jgi:hypothetical protein